MSMLTMPLWLFLSGIAALAVIVTVAQLLRHRYRPVLLATNQFWAMALQKAPARQLFAKFRHFFAWLLVFLLLALMWLVVAEPHVESNTSQRSQLFYLDASAVMQEQGRFEQAKQALIQQLNQTPSDARRVLLASANSAGIATILAPNEPIALLEKRLDNLTFTPQPSTLPAWVASKVAALSADDAAQPLDIHLFGGPVLPALTSVPASVAAKLTITQQAAYQIAQANVGIVALSQQSAASGNADLRDVYFRLASNQPLTSTPSLQVTSDAAPAVALAPQALGENQFVLRDMAANDQTLTIELTQPDALMADNRASIQLAQQPLVKVSVAASVPERLQRMLQLNSGLQLLTADASDSADVLVQPLSAASANDRTPSLRLSTDNNLVVHYLAQQDNPQQLEALLASVSNGVAVQLQAADHRAVQLPISWFDATESNQRMLPVVVSRLLSWLADVACADVEPQLSQAGFGECAFTQVQSPTALLARQIAAANAPAMGLLDSATTQQLTTGASTDGASERNLVGQAPAVETPAVATDVWSWASHYLTTVLLLFILTLLTVEWLALRRNLIP
ncbi:hypothetical protein L9G15_00860 [Shewanella sp. A3A]|nr:hypothetical protein [Shewanella ferrihydritica]